ncbi:MAG TPA: UDP-N-acetylmuramoyl-tripeptide--D-alanyl-D-alanine ligase, partial [Acidimicrobiales bacterium]|nr:UDP-N-acetylmuramoyl-tripeptide--D-alanyl-D-alanine ligase [Acidimicrobiales bacterium]
PARLGRERRPGPDGAVRLTLAEIAGATGGEVRGGDPGAAVTSYSIDSRTLAPGALFVALRAERDGHDFVGDALDRGAAGALVSRPGDGAGEGPVKPPGLVVVEDTAAALTALGRLARHRLAGAAVVGITGSTGKTSTKDLTAAALAPAGPVGASPTSFNNEIGVPLTLLSAPDGAAAVVVEMGARGVGHIATLAAVAEPTIGVITNIGMAHAEFFGSREEVARAKGELLEALPPDGHGVLNADDDFTPALRARTAAAVLTAGSSAGADVRVSGLRLDDDLRPAFRLDTPWGPVEVPPLPMRGAHQAGNAALAVAVAGLAGVDPEAAGAGLAGAVGSPLRMDLRRSPAGLVVLNDSYNANPTSMAAALDALGRLAVGGGRRYAVLGPMAELGPHSTSEHHRLGKLVAATGVELLVAVGAPELAEGARAAGAEAVDVDTADAAVGALAPRLRAGDAVLVKASRVVGLERVAAALLDRGVGGA